MPKEADWAVNTLTGLLGSPNLNGKQGITRLCSGIDGSQRIAKVLTSGIWQLLGAAYGGLWRSPSKQHGAGGASLEPHIAAGLTGNAFTENHHKMTQLDVHVGVLSL